jgi:uncharacterized protein
MRAFLMASLLVLTFASSAPAQLTNLPVLTQPINDFAGIIDADSLRTLNERIAALKAATGDSVVITTVGTTAPWTSVEEYAVKLFEKAGIGDRKLDNGILILVAVKEHGIRVEVGYGLEEFVTDGYAGDTIRQLMVPEFRANRYGPGLVAGTTQLITRITEGRGGTLVTNPPAPPAETTSLSKTSLILGAIVILVLAAGAVGLVVFVISRIAKAAGGARDTPVSGWPLSGSDTSGSSDSSSSSDDSSSSSSSDDSSFGGGSSGGGGASGSW